jgi:erythromycin esterase-like protein
MTAITRYQDEVAALAVPLGGLADLDPLLERAAGARVVLLGEASHGTHEFYRWRARLTRRLIEELGFSFVAVEGDWPDCARVDRAVRGLEGVPADPHGALAGFERWPTWMWANEEVTEFCRWLRDHNLERDERDRVGFHGLDVYSLWESVREILAYLRQHDPQAVPVALEAYRCFEPYGADPQRYAMATRFVSASCEDEVVRLLTAARERAAADGSAELGVWQNAEVVAGAEQYYRAMIAGGPQAWNVRDRHMDATLDRLLSHYGTGAKAVVWAHNTHVGDGQATDMAAAGMVTIGQLARERYGRRQVLLVGFGCDHGTVVAADAWGAPMAVMSVPPARPGSLEALLDDYAPARALFVFPDREHPGDRARAGLPEYLGLLDEPLDHRAIGVVYDPRHERSGNYVPTRLGERYDAFCWFDRTQAVHPLHTRRVDLGEPETYPAGV